MLLPRLRTCHVPPDWTPTLIVVVDTEEEFDWHAKFNPASTSVRNIQQQIHAQSIFDAHGICPTYVIDHPVASNPEAAGLLAGFAADGRCEIGAHLHPWVNPPHEGPIDAQHSYPGNLPPELERAKIAALTDAILAGTGVKPVVYKAGRYGVGAATAGILAELGYKVDCSVVPWTDFSADGGPDFSTIPDQPFEITAGLIELPLSVGFAGRMQALGPSLYRHLQAGVALRLPGIAARSGMLERLRLSPEGHDLQDLRRQTRAGIDAGKRLFMLTYHSSSLLPGATPYVRSEADLARFIGTIAGYCRFFHTELNGRFARVADIASALLPPTRQAA